ncbi:MAG: CpsD/CapB family tyrosine-protein kinase [Oscillospiraceae bacterium]|nr:CpsD/CapB family tyrosine-protein kinase [Oscillospiraceae bacterium]
MNVKRPENITPVTPEQQRIGTNLSFAVSEAYKLLRANIMFSLPNDGDRCRVLGVTSSLPSEGKSTTSLNLACSIAETGKRVLVIEGDMRLPTMSKRLDVPKSPGLSNLLAGLCSGNEIIHHSGLVDGLDVMAGGDIPPNPSELLGSTRMAKVVEALAKGYDYIIFDLPPISSVSDALVISNLLDGMVVVVRRDYCDQQTLAETVRQLEFHNVKVLGFVFTYSEVLKKKYKKYKKGKGYGYGYKYGYGYEYGYGHSYEAAADASKKKSKTK